MKKVSITGLHFFIIGTSENDHTPIYYVELEINGKWIPILEGKCVHPTSVIVEPAGIESCINNAS